MSSHFKTPEGEAAYLAAYTKTLESWPVPFAEIEIPTSHGTSYIVASGPKDAPPLVLLHGFFTTLLLWIPNIAALSKEYRVYAIDLMGNRNRSVPGAPIADVDGLVDWLIETLFGLGLDRFYLAGMSFGGWLAINLTLAAPERVRRLALISPAASLLPLVKQFTLRVMASMLPPRRFWFESLMGWMGIKGGEGNEFSQRLLDLMWLGGEHIKMSPETMRVMPTVFSDEELDALRPPVLLLIGENEVIYDAANALTRARCLIPDLEGELVPQCGHDITFSQHELVDARLLEFLNEGGQDAA
ncbi:alpha/beta fold hydrolase [Candidatus Bipolaricaulota bacterium]